ncbi:Phosphoadenosine phosphosulphate reductase domain-containing protein, partial [Dysosmobacter welbionis]
ARRREMPLGRPRRHPRDSRTSAASGRTPVSHTDGPAPRRRPYPRPGRRRPAAVPAIARSSQIPFDSFRHPIHVFQRVHLHDLFLVVAGVGHALQIPAVVAAGLQHGYPLALGRGGQLKLPYRCVAPLRKRRQGRDGLALQRGFGLLEQPGVAEAPATDHGHVRFGVLENADRVLRLPDIAVGDHRDGHSLLHRPNAGPVRLTAVHLGPGPAVDRHGGGPCLLQDSGELHAVAAAHVPAPAELGGHRHRDGFHHCLHDASGLFRVLHQGGPVAVVDDLAHGA